MRRNFYDYVQGFPANRIIRNTVRSSIKCVNHEIRVRMEINNKQVAFVTFIDFLSLTELTLHLEKNKA